MPQPQPQPQTHPRIHREYLREVPLSESRTVRLLGARWDGEAQLFWIDPTWPDVSRFARWLAT